MCLPKQQLLFLINIFEKVLKQRDDSILILIGNDSSEIGEKIHDLVKKKNLSDKVIFTGIRSDVNRILQAIDVFVFPSLFEGLPVSLVEAQAAGLPCVISDTIPSDCKITNLIYPVSLTENVDKWAEEVLTFSNCSREDTSDQIKSSGFDIRSNAEWLMNFYIEEYNKVI